MREKVNGSRVFKRWLHAARHQRSKKRSKWAKSCRGSRWTTRPTARSWILV